MDTQPSQTNTTSSSSSSSTTTTHTPKYYCHTCKKETVPIPVPVDEGEPELQCPVCKDDFVEELEEPTPPPPPQAPLPQAAPLPNPLQYFFPPPNNNGQVQLLPLAQALRQWNIRATNNNGVITIQTGPLQFHTHTHTHAHAHPHAHPPSPQPSNVHPHPMPIPNLNNLFNAFNPFIPNIHFGGGPMVGNPGDYVFGPNFENILNQLFQNANHTGAPPAAKSALDDLKKGQIDASHIESKADCAICKEEFTLGSEYVEMPCKHIFDKECIMQWLGIHNSCPVCRFELKTDNPDYEARHRR